MDHCLTPETIASNIVVTSASGLFAEAVAEQTLALLLGLLRGLPTFFRAQQSQEFIRRPTGDLHGKTVGIVGLGGNGTRLAEVLRAFKTRTIATDMFVEERPACVDALWPADQLPRLLAESDAVILCVPLKDPAWMRVHDVHDIPPELRNEIEHFFQVYKDLEEEKVETHGYGNRVDAERVVAEARARAAA